MNSFYALLTPILYSSDFDGYGDFPVRDRRLANPAKEPLVGTTPVQISYGMNAYLIPLISRTRGRELSWRRRRAPGVSTTMLMAGVAYIYNHPPIVSLGNDQTG